jgi:hypothetical protein
MMHADKDSKSKLELLHSPFEPKTAELAEAVPPYVAANLIDSCHTLTKVDTAVVLEDGLRRGLCRDQLLNTRNRRYPPLCHSESGARFTLSRL